MTTADKRRVDDTVADEESVVLSSVLAAAIILALGIVLLVL